MGARPINNILKIKMNSQKDIEQLLHLINLERKEESRLSQEILANMPLPERKEKGITWHPVVINNEEIGVGQQIILTLERTSLTDQTHRFRQGQTAALFNNSNEKDTPISGVIKKIKDNILQLAVSTDQLPEWVDSGRLGLNLLYNETTFKEMEIALTKLQKAENGRLAELREILFGYQQPFFKELPYSIEIPPLNDSQNKAIELVAKAQDIAIIHGPPGTGKTTTLVQAIKFCLKTEKQVLVCAPSNTAVDLLTQKLTELGLSTVRLGHPARVNEQLLSRTFEAQIAAHPRYKQLKQYRKEATQLRQQARKWKRSFAAVDREERREKLKLAKELLDYARQLEQFISKDVIEKSQVVACTLVGSAGRALRSFQFSTVFIDEAAQSLAPATWIPITRANRVVLAGDHCQLPPTVKSAEAMKQGLMKSLFETCIEKLHADTMLSTQYRMHQQIMEFSNQQFYEKGLKAHESVSEKTLGEDLLLFTPADFVDTAGTGYEEEQKKEGLSRFNSQEGDLLLKYLSKIYQQLAVEQPDEVHKITTGIISPYKAQVHYLRDHLLDYETLHKYQDNITIHTVDGFQGQERDIIGISLVRSNDSGEIGFLADTRRMNVAMTRAKKKLVMVGDSATLGSHRFYKSFLKFMEHEANYTTAWEYIY